MITSDWIDSKLNTIINDDCLNVMRKIPDKYFDLVLTDPPYNITKNEWDAAIDLKSFWQEINRINKGASIIFCAQPFTTDLINANRKNFRYTLIWDKVLPTGFLNANKMPLRVHEDICVFMKVCHIIILLNHKVTKEKELLKETLKITKIMETLKIMGDTIQQRDIQHQSCNLVMGAIEHQ